MPSFQLPALGSSPSLRRIGSLVALPALCLCIMAAVSFFATNTQTAIRQLAQPTPIDLPWSQRRLLSPADKQPLHPEAGIGRNDNSLLWDQTSSRPLKLKLERKKFDDRFMAFAHSVHSDRVRVNGMVERLRRRLTQSTSQFSALSPNSSQTPGIELTSLVISGSSVGSGEYFVSLDVGSPPQKLFLIADTGSDLTWVKCSPCIGCSMTSQSFNAEDSSSFTPISCLSRECSLWSSPPSCDAVSRDCKYEYSYSDQSITIGTLAFESITLQSSSGKTIEVKDLVLGCGRQNSGPNFAKSGGVIGLGQGPMSFTSQLAQQSYTNKFSYCLASFFDPASVSGSLTFGNTSNQTTLQYTPLIKNPYAETFYYVDVEEVRVGGIVLPIPASVWSIDPQGNGGTLVDSGTTLAQFAQPAYEMILAAFQEAVQYPRAAPFPALDLCYNVTGIPNPTFPEFSITLQGNSTLQPSQQNYFTDAADGIKCLAMQGVPSPGFSVIGNLLQQNFHIEFDRLANRLGFASANCSELHSSTP